MNRFAALSLLTLSLFATEAMAELRLPSLFGHHMVLQRDQENPVWGWADHGADVSVTFGGHTLQTKANEEGKWMLKLKPMKGSSHALNMMGKSDDESLTLSNIVIGEVWVCSGQSNMQWALSQVYDPDLEIMSANYPNIRIISVPQVGTQDNQDDIDGQWDICTPATIALKASTLGESGIPFKRVDNSTGWASRSASRRALINKALISAMVPSSPLSSCFPDCSGKTS